MSALRGDQGITAGARPDAPAVPGCSDKRRRRNRARAKTDRYSSNTRTCRTPREKGRPGRIRGDGVQRSPSPA